MVAIDQRPAMTEPMARALGGSEVDAATVVALKRRLAATLSPHATALLIDPLYGYPALLGAADPRRGLILALEHHRTESGPNGRRSRLEPEWTAARIKRAGADAVKLLVWHRHDADVESRLHQQRLVEAVGRACDEAGIVFLLEILIHPLDGEAPAAYAARRPELVLRAVEDFTDPCYRVDIYKLETPCALDNVPLPGAAGAEAVDAAFAKLVAGIAVPWVLLSGGADFENFRRALTFAYAHGAAGFLAGRVIWQGALARFHEPDRLAAELSEHSVPALKELAAFTERLAKPVAVAA
jgi:tagatose 1,6-diphosphate aldolase